MAVYKKLIVAVIGLAIFLVNKYFGFDLGAQEAVLVDGVIALLTAVGVWKVENAPNPTA